MMREGFLLCGGWEAEVIPRYVSSALLGAVLLATGSAAMAADYRPDDFLVLDLSKAVLSPVPLGPPTQFAPVAVEARGGQASEPKWASEDLKAEPKPVPVQRVEAAHANRVARARSETLRGVPRTRLAHRHGGPLDAQAMDTRIQSWPCKPGGGGICNWKQ
jgi:hypothetical protein